MGWLDNILILPGNTISVHPTECTLKPQVYISEMFWQRDSCFCTWIFRAWNIQTWTPFPSNTKQGQMQIPSALKAAIAMKYPHPRIFMIWTTRHPSPEGIIFVYMRENKGSWRILLALVTARESPPNYMHHFFIYSMASHAHIFTLKRGVINVPLISFDFFFW